MKAMTMPEQTQPAETKQDDTVYEERIVAFVDILGFRSLIERTETDQALAENVLWILDYVRGMRDENRACADPECDVVGRQITIFSDSVVISYPTYSPSCLFYAILDRSYAVDFSCFSGSYFS
jgi:hypothetical protein